MLTGSDIAGNWRYWDNRQNAVYYSARSTAESGDQAFSLEAPGGAVRKRAVRTNEAIASAGVYTKSDRVWLVPVENLPAALSINGLKPGDRVREDDDTDWTVLEAELITWDTIWKLTTRNLVLAHQLRDSITILRPTNTQDAAANRVPTYAAVYSAIAGRVQEIDGERGESHGKVGLARNYTAIMGQRVTITTEDRFQVGAVVYQVKGYTEPDRIDVLMQVQLERLP